MKLERLNPDKMRSIIQFIRSNEVQEKASAAGKIISAEYGTLWAAALIEQLLL